MRAIVLSGGGAKGAYQMGVWKALRKLGKDFDIVTGTSIGAFNGAMMVQKDYIKCLWLWKNISPSFLFDGIDENIDDVSMMKLYVKKFIKDGGMDVSKLELNLKKYINLKKFYNSNINYGLVTFNITTLKPITLVKKEIPREQLHDYLMASATCFPAFKKKKIENSDYIDGGYYDNLPINLAIDMGATEIIAVDLGTVGFKKKVKNKKIKVKYITPRNKLDSFLKFSKESAEREIRYGYNDLMKEFKKLDGNKYTFKFKDLDRNLMNYIYPFINVLKEILGVNKDKTIMEEILKVTNFYQIINNNLSVSKKVFNETIENAGKLLELDDSLVYKIDKYNKILFEKLNNVEDFNFEWIENKIKSGDVKSLLNTSYIVKYLYNKITSDKFGIKSKKEISKLALIFRKELNIAIYIYVVNKRGDN